MFIFYLHILIYLVIKKNSVRTLNLIQKKKSMRTNTNICFQVFDSAVLIQSNISSKNELHILGGTVRGEAAAYVQRISLRC